MCLARTACRFAQLAVDTIVAGTSSSGYSAATTASRPWWWPGGVPTEEVDEGEGHQLPRCQRHERFSTAAWSFPRPIRRRRTTYMQAAWTAARQKPGATPVRPREADAGRSRGRPRRPLNGRQRLNHRYGGAGLAADPEDPGVDTEPPDSFEEAAPSVVGAAGQGEPAPTALLEPAQEAEG